MYNHHNISIENIKILYSKWKIVYSSKYDNIFNNNKKNNSLLTTEKPVFGNNLKKLKYFN